MTDLSGITVTPGVLPPQQKEALASALDRIGGKMIDTVRIDTTHFVCTEGRGPLWEKAVEMNIPVVVPEWVDACESEGTIVSVRGYYLNADPKNRHLGTINSNTQHQRTTSTVSSAQPQYGADSSRASHAPEREEPASEPPTTPFPGGPTSGQPTAEEKEVSEGDQTPPPPPPKDEEAEPEKGAPEEQPEQNGEPKSAEDGPPSEEQKEEDEEKEKDQELEQEQEKESTPQEEDKAEEQDQPSSNGEHKGKGKESEGDSFNEVPL